MIVGDTDATRYATQLRLRLINYCGFSTLDHSAGYGGSFRRVAILEHNLTSGVLTSSLLRDPSDQYLCESATPATAPRITLTRLARMPRGRAAFPFLPVSSFHLFRLKESRRRTSVTQRTVSYYTSSCYDAGKISRARVLDEHF